MLKAMRWTDNSMGSNFDYGWSDINQAFAAGKVGMYISGSDVYTNLVQASNIDPTHLRHHDDSAREEQDRRRARRRHARRRPAERERRRARRGRQVDRLLLRAEARSTKTQAIRNAKTLVANKQPVGVPALPLFNKAQYDRREHVDQALHQRPAQAR